MKKYIESAIIGAIAAAVMIPALTLLVMELLHITPSTSEIVYFSAITVVFGVAMAMFFEPGIRWAVAAGTLRWLFVLVVVFIPNYLNAVPIVYMEFAIEYVVMVGSYVVAYLVYRVVASAV